MEESIKIGLLGCGTVGSSVLEVLERNEREIAGRCGARLEVKRVLVRDLSKERPAGVRKELLVSDPGLVVDDPEIKIVVEVMGGIEPAKDYIIRALSNGKHVVTANKDLISLCGRELFEVAGSHRVDLLFEASVAGGIPIISSLKEALVANRIKCLMGIVNGTTNYILTRMTLDGVEYREALREAQSKGYAEADPAQDVSGHDAARKMAILASIAFNTRITYPQVYAEGITGISPLDIVYARELGYVIKLLGIARERNGEVEVRVHPAFLPQSHPLASVNGVYNAIFVEGYPVGVAMFYGQGAGGAPTASAVVGDIIACVRNLLHGVSGRVSCTCYEEKRVKDIREIETQFYVRLLVKDRPGVLAGIAKAFGDNEVSLASVIQKRTEGDMAEIVVVTHRIGESNASSALEIIRKLPTVGEVSSVIRVEQ